MQRWIAIVVVAVLLLVGGVGFGYYTYKQNRPYPVWVPLPIMNPQWSEARRDEFVKTLKSKLSEQEMLVRVSQDVGLVAKWHLVSDEAGANEIRKRLIVSSGEFVSEAGRLPALNVGVDGRKKEREVLGELAMRLVDDVCRIEGIKPPPKKGR